MTATQTESRGDGGGDSKGEAGGDVATASSRVCVIQLGSDAMTVCFNIKQSYKLIGS